MTNSVPNRPRINGVLARIVELKSMLRRIFSYFTKTKVLSMGEETPHKRYGRRARRLYRLLIIVCLVAVILAVIALYLGDRI